MPATGEPEDIIYEVPLLAENSRIGPYYEVVVLNTSGYPRGATPTSVCSACGREEINSKQRLLMMFDEMWNGHSIFLLSTTLYVIVTDQLKEILARLNPTNVAFTEI